MCAPPSAGADWLSAEDAVNWAPLNTIAAIKPKTMNRSIRLNLDTNFLIHNCIDSDLCAKSVSVESAAGVLSSDFCRLTIRIRRFVKLNYTSA